MAGSQENGPSLANRVVRILGKVRTGESRRLGFVICW